MALPGALTLAQLKTKARSKSGVGSSDYSDASLLIELNQAYGIMCRYLAQLGEDYFEEDNAKFNLALNSSLYSLPTDCIAVKQIRLAYATPSTNSDYVIANAYDNTDVHNISADEESVSSANPIVDITNNYFRIKPKPTAAITNGGAISYIAMPSALVNSADTTVLPDTLADKIAVYGAKEMAFKLSKWNKWKVLSAEWQAMVANWESSLSDRQMDRVLRFKSPMEVPVNNRRPVRELP